jgi:hypothetical protein
MSFPATLPSYTITTGAESPNTAGGGLGLSGLLNAFETDITGLGTKMGTGASTPTNGVVLAGNGTGTSAWVTPESMLSGLADNTTSDVSTSKHGLTPKAPNDTAKYLRGDGAWATMPYIIKGGISVTAPADATTYYGADGTANTTLETNSRIYIAIAGTITAAYINAGASGTVGTNETSTLSVRLNNTTDTTLSSAIVLSSGAVAYSNTGLSIPVVVGDFIDVKIVTATWATNPGSIVLSYILRVN